MPFKRTKVNFKLEKIISLLLAATSYIFVLIFIGSIVEKISTFGNLSYALSFLGIQTLISVFNNFIERDIIKDFFKDWIELSPGTHFLIIFDCLVWLNFINLINSEEYESKRF